MIDQWALAHAGRPSSQIKMPEITLVKLWRETPVMPGGPTTMDCHPDEVAGCLALDWKVVENAQSQSEPEPEIIPTAELPTTPKLKRNK